MSTLAEKSCQPIAKGSAALSEQSADELRRQLHADWQVQHQPPQLQRLLKFKNYYETIAFVNALAWVAHQQDHHPDIEVSYNRCMVRYSTHSIGGLSENDFICAAKIDALFKPDP